MNAPPLAIACLFVAISASVASGQHIYLDAGGNARNDREERLPRLGWTHLDVWLDTGRNRDGSRAGTSGRHDVVEYSFVLQSRSRVEWGTFTPASATMRVARGPLEDSLTYFVGVRCNPPLKSGRHRLGRIRLKARYGQGLLNPVPCAVIGDLVITSFRTEPGGRVHRLGPTLTPDAAIVRGEWHDADGLIFATEPGGSAGPVRAEYGCLYLGWNPMSPPYELRIVDGRVVVNGWALPLELGRRIPPSRALRKRSGADDLVASAEAVGRALHRLGRSDSSATEGMATALRVSGAADSVEVEDRDGHSLRVYTKGSGRGRGLIVGRWGARSLPAVDPDSAMAQCLDEWARSLDQGALLQIRGVGSTFLSRCGDLTLPRAIESLQRARPLTAADSSALRRIARTWEDWDAIEHPVALERVHP